MTKLAKQREREKAQRAALREKRRAVKARAELRRVARKAKQAIKMAPRHALAAWAAVVRAVGRCAVCGATEHLQAHHLLPKERYPEFRTDPMNGICLCPIHHKWGRYSFHRNMIWATIWLREHRYDQYIWCKRHMGKDAVEL